MLSEADGAMLEADDYLLGVGQLLHDLEYIESSIAERLGPNAGSYADEILLMSSPHRRPNVRRLRAAFELFDLHLDAATLKRERAQFSVEARIDLLAVDAMSVDEFTDAMQRQRGAAEANAGAGAQAAMLDAVRDDLVAGGSTGQGTAAAQPAAGDHTCRPIVFHGNNCYSIDGGEPVAVDDSESYVFQAFIESPALSLADLEKKSGVNRPSEVLARLAEKYGGRFAAAIRRPGGKSKGGYRVAIRRAASDQP